MKRYKFNTKLLRDLPGILGKTEKEIANSIGYGDREYRNWCEGKNLTLEVIKKLCDKYGLIESYFVIVEDDEDVDADEDDDLINEVTLSDLVSADHKPLVQHLDKLIDLVMLRMNNDKYAVEVRFGIKDTRFDELKSNSSKAGGININVLFRMINFCRCDMNSIFYCHDRDFPAIEEFDTDNGVWFMDLINDYCKQFIEWATSHLPKALLGIIESWISKSVKQIDEKVMERF